MKLAVIFIGTGDYINFLPSYYEACEEFLVPNTEKTYFVFTDGDIGDPPENVKLYEQEHLPWPYITLERFKYILKAESDLAEFDYVLFLDADTRVVETVTEEELFTDKKYIGVHHPCHYMKFPPHDNIPGAFDVTPLSRACVAETDDLSVYVQGCLWGGKMPYVMEMIEELHKRTIADLADNVIATWHDESHLNKFYIEHRDEVFVASPSLAFPELFEQHCTFDAKIVHLAKDNSKYHV